VKRSAEQYPSTSRRSSGSRFWTDETRLTYRANGEKGSNMKELNMKTAIKRYNDIMNSICREHNTIGERLSDGTENWNLRDMVSEMQYTFDLWNEPGSVAYDDAHDEFQPVRNGRREWYYNWQLEKARMKRFIEAYEPFIGDMECAISHCSRFD
jgi:hypothetical protein